MTSQDLCQSPLCQCTDKALPRDPVAYTYLWHKQIVSVAAPSLPMEQELDSKGGSWPEWTMEFSGGL